MSRYEEPEEGENGTGSTLIDQYRKNNHVSTTAKAGVFEAPVIIAVLCLTKVSCV
jgi:hypothetical protein